MPDGTQLASTGVPGLDALFGGGLPRARNTLLAGGPGCGKTILALETLVRGARDHGEPGIFVAFEESARNIVEHAHSFGWDLEELQKKKLFFLDARLPSTVVQEGAFDLQGLLAGLSEKCRRMGTRRIVFDGINTLLSFLNDPAAERREIYRLGEWIAAEKLTGIITAKGDIEASFLPERDGYMQYLADCVISLHHRLSGSVPLRRLRVVKCRGVQHVTAEVPFLILATGVEVAALPADMPAGLSSTERISTGVPRLDTMLRGGIYRGASVLISGVPGTAKSTLASAFSEAACRRKERTLYVTFDQSEAQLVRDMASVNIRLAPHVRSGLLRIVAGHRSARSAMKDAAWILRLARDHRAQCVVVDPISALGSGGGDDMGEEAATYLLRVARAENLTIVNTTLLSGSDALGEATATGISTIADTWIHVAYVASSGERNRSLTVVKSRGVGHSNQVRELILSDQGITLADVYAADGQVLMGTLRWEKENEERLARERRKEEMELRQQTARIALAETKAQLALLEQELVSREAALRHAVEDATRSENAAALHASEIRRLRTADRHPSPPRAEKILARPRAARTSRKVRR